MAATVTLDKVLALAAQLAAKDREKLFQEMREQRRAVWLKETEAAADEAERLRREGKLTGISSKKDIKSWLDNLLDSDKK